MEKRKFAVIGMGKFGFKLVEELNQMGLEVIAIDKSAKKIEKVRDIATESLILDTIDKESLEKSGVKDVDIVIVGMGEDMESNILITTILKELGAKLIISRAISHIHAKILREVGADKIVFPEEDMAIRLAHAIHFPGVQEYIDLKGPWDLAEFKISQESRLIGEKIGGIRSQSKYEVDILMIEKEKIPAPKAERRKEERESIIPRDNYVIQKDDILILFGKPENLRKFIEKISS